jgi:rare lipoprotein A
MTEARFAPRRHISGIAYCVVLSLLGLAAQSCAIIGQRNSPTSLPEALPAAKPAPALNAVKPPSISSPTMQRGEASWYGPGFHGKKTASGDAFDQTELTAAHPSFPLGSRVKVTNLKNGKTAEVEIKDRGPFVQGRIIDVSKAAAEKLGMIGSGTVPVQVELLSDSRHGDEASRASKD